MAKRKSQAAKKAADEGAEAPANSRRLPPLTRDVGVQSKGPRLQRLRAALMLVKATANYPDVNVYAAVELQGDVFVSSADATKSEEYVEENKNYDPSVSFTMNSNEVLNSLVSFCDLYVSKGCSKCLRMGFYSPNNFTTENNTSRTRQAGIDWPDGPMLDFLSSGRIDDPKVLEAAKRAIVAEYDRQASARGDCLTNKPSTFALGNLGMLKGWCDGQWKDFLGQIEWKFGEHGTESIIQDLVDAIQASPMYSEQLAGKENQIIALLIDLIDKRQAIQDPTQRFIHVAEVILAFKEVENGTVKLPDPTWQMWEQLPRPSDTRNIEDKVAAYCPTALPETISRLSRRAAQSMVEQRALDDDKQVLALKYQIYDACEQRLSELSRAEGIADEARLQNILSELLKTAEQRFGQCSVQYHYRLVSPSSVQAMVYELFDSCYLSFDGGQPA